MFIFNLERIEFMDIGVDYWMLGFVPYHNTESTRLFADEVIPELI
jgi:hypothetical protein